MKHKLSPFLCVAALFAVVGYSQPPKVVLTMPPGHGKVTPPAENVPDDIAFIMVMARIQAEERSVARRKAQNVDVSKNHGFQRRYLLTDREASLLREVTAGCDTDLQQFRRYSAESMKQSDGKVPSRTVIDADPALKARADGLTSQYYGIVETCRARLRTGLGQKRFAEFYQLAIGLEKLTIRALPIEASTGKGKEAR